MGKVIEEESWGAVRDEKRGQAKREGGQGGVREEEKTTQEGM